MSVHEIPLPEDLDRFVREQVASGAYADTAALIRDAIQRLADDASFPFEAKMALVKEEVRLGLEDVAAGRLSDRSMDEIIAEAERR